MQKFIEHISLRSGDGLYNAGLVGFMKVLDFGRIPYTTTGTELTVSPRDVIENFADAYFGCLLDCYGRRTAAWRLKEDLFVIRLRSRERSADFLTFLENTVKSLSDRMAKNSYLAAAEIIRRRGEVYDFQGVAKAINAEKDIEKQIALLGSFLEKFDMYLTVFQLKDIAYNYVQSYWNGIAFLHKQKNTDDFVSTFQKEFIRPIETARPKENKEEFFCFQCGRALPPGKESMAWINDQGVDIRRKTNGFWNFEVDLSPCPYCRLVYACMPLGFRTMGHEGIFVNDNRSLRRLREANNYDAAEEERRGDTFGVLIGNFILNAEIKEAENRLQNIQVIRREASGYRVNILSARLIRSLSFSGGDLKKLLKSNRIVFREVISAILDGRELYDYILQACRNALSMGGPISIYYNVLQIQRNLYSKGVYHMKTYMEEGRKVGKAMRARMAARVNEKKTIGLTYALLSALQTRDVDRFVVTIVRQYTSLGMEIPEIFFYLKDSDRAFLDIGQAFVIGLNSENTRVAEKGEKA